MIKISSKSQYGLRAMTYLAKKKAVCSAGTIAHEEGIPANFLEKILVSLKKAGLITVKSGTKGGYSLASSSKKITVGDIVRPLEEKMVFAFCLDKGFSCPKEKECLVKKVWLKIQNSLNQSLDSMTLFSLINEKN